MGFCVFVLLWRKLTFWSGLNIHFRKREIEITVTDIIKDETEFLLKDPKNRAHLLKAIEEVKRNKNLVRFTGEEFKKYSETLLNK